MAKIRIKNSGEILSFKDWNEAEDYIYTNLVDLLED